MPSMNTAPMGRPFAQGLVYTSGASAVGNMAFANFKRDGPPAGHHSAVETHPGLSKS